MKLDSDGWLDEWMQSSLKVFFF